jgi:hypothetical protein
VPSPPFLSLLSAQLIVGATRLVLDRQLAVAQVDRPREPLAGDPPTVHQAYGKLLSIGTTIPVVLAPRGVWHFAGWDSKGPMRGVAKTVASTQYLQRRCRPYWL